MFQMTSAMVNNWSMAKIVSFRFFKGYHSLGRMQCKSHICPADNVWVDLKHSDSGSADCSGTGHVCKGTLVTERLSGNNFNEKYMKT